MGMLWWMSLILLKPSNIDKIHKYLTRPDMDKIFKEYNELKHDRK